MKRIAIAVKTAEGGRWILPQIAEARARGLLVVVILPEGTGRLAVAVSNLIALDDGVSLVRSPFAFKFLPRLSTVIGLWRFHRLLRSLNLDSILYHLFATALAVRIASVGLRARRVHMVAGPLYLESSRIRAFERVLAYRDNMIVCGSQFTADRYRELGLPVRRLVVIPYGVDTAVFSIATPRERERARANLGIPGDSFVAVMVAYVYAPKKLVFAERGIKGHADLLESWRQFHRIFPKSTLLLVGAGFDEVGEKYRQKLITQVEGGLETNGIKWLRSLDNVQEAYSSADVSVSPSLSENHGAALEASAMGVPPIVSDAGALPETVSGQSGWIHIAGSVPDLLRALCEAHADWVDGSLTARGEAARQLMLTRFDQARSTKVVIDIVMNTKAEVPTHAR